MSTELRDLYQDLISTLVEAGVGFWDTDIFGPGVTISVKHYRAKHIIVVGNSKTWKQRCFVLAHEIGHLFYIVRGEDVNGLTLRKSVAGEEVANRVACKILDSVDLDLKKDYVDFYNRFNKNTRRKKFKL